MWITAQQQNVDNSTAQDPQPVMVTAVMLISITAVVTTIVLTAGGSCLVLHFNWQAGWNNNVEQ
jgi:hypothetical protein